MEINKKRNELNEMYSNDIKKKLTFLKQRYYEAISYRSCFRNVFQCTV